MRSFNESAERNIYLDKSIIVWIIDLGIIMRVSSKDS